MIPSEFSFPGGQELAQADEIESFGAWRNRTMKNQKGYTVVELLIVVVIVFMIFGVGIGWVKNIIKLTRCDFEAPYKAEIIHGIGLIPPVGMVTGWMDVGR